MWFPSIVGFVEVPHATPLAVICSIPSLVMFPPVTAEFRVMAVTSAVVSDAIDEVLVVKLVS